MGCLVFLGDGLPGSIVKSVVCLVAGPGVAMMDHSSATTFMDTDH